MRRREFIILLGGSAVAPLAARRAAERTGRRIGVLISNEESDPHGQARVVGGH